MQNFQMSFKCVFDVNGGIDRNARIVPGQNNEVFIECDPFEV